MDCPQCGYVMDAFMKECPKCAHEKAHPDKMTAVATAPQPPPTPAIPLPKAPPSPSRPARVRETVRYEPELGWPLTIVLWLVIAIHALFIGLVVAGLFFPAIFIPSAVRLVSAIALLRSKRWGFYVFGFISVGGLIMSLITFNIIRIIVDVVPAILIAFFVLKQWEEFE